MRRLCKGLAASLALSAACPLAADSASLPARCEQHEEQLFTCSTGSKQLSVCASRGWSSETGTLQYRYGSPDKAQIVLPRKPETPASSALAGVAMFSGGGGAWLRFRNGDIDYVVFTAASSSWGEKSGVVVEKAGKRLRAISCRGRTSSELGPELFRRGGFKPDDHEFTLP